MAKVFFSYSHKDETMRNELNTHLSMLRRDGTVESWSDHRILAGTDVDAEIDNNLEQADIILLLVSPYFIDSDYCFNREMQRAMEKHHDSSATVIPVILRPCDWHSAPFGKLKGVPTDGKPISQYADHHEGMAIVAKEIRRVAVKYPSDSAVAAPALSTQVRPIAPMHVAGSAMPRSSNLAIKRKFDDHERDEFLENTFEYIARFFEGSLQELSNRNTQIKTRFKRIDANSFAAWIYDNGQKVSECYIYGGSGAGFRGSSICYSSTADTSRNSFNESFSVADDGLKLYLTALMNGQKQLTAQGVSELLWSSLIARLQQ